MTEQSPHDVQAVPSVPATLQYTARGCFPSEESARTLATCIQSIVKELSRYFDLSTLDGVTIAEDYPQALKELYRGYQTSFVLTPTNGTVAGVAMAPRVFRDGQLKTHIVLNANNVAVLTDMADPDFNSALYVLAHECGHVEVTARFDSAFPGMLLRHKFSSLLEERRWGVILPVWDEYAVCKISRGFGEDPTSDHEQTFLGYLSSTLETVNTTINAYRLHRNVETLLIDVYRTFGNLLKYAAYYLGSLAGAGKSWTDSPVACEAMKASWFRPFLERLSGCLSAIADGYGNWVDKSKFEAVGDIVDDMVRFGGVQAVTMPGGGAQVNLI